MPITMQHAEHLTPVEIEQFLDAGTTLSFAGTGRKEIYALLERTLRARRYPGLSKDKGVVPAIWPRSADSACRKSPA